MYKKLCTITVILLLTIMVAGCGSEKKAKDDTVIPSEYVIAASDNESITKLIEDYYTSLFASPPESYVTNSVAGTVPEKIKGFVANKTIDEGQGNPEIGLHYPRFVGVNGLTAVNYQIIKVKEKPAIKSEFIGMDGNSYLYFVKIDLMAKCIRDSIFTSMYKENAADRTYIKNGTLDGKPASKIRIEARYDVQIIKDDGKFKILKASEAANQYGYKNRLFRLNNDFISRLSYLDLEKDSSGSYINGNDGKQYEQEKNMIQVFFNSMKNIDSDRMQLLKVKWNKGQADFQGLLEKFKVAVGKEGKTMLVIGSDYKQKFDVDSFPLQPIMQEIINFNGFEITPHPTYSNGSKKYIVKMEADVRQINGISDK
ncbi:MAG TPA: hypothetical protein VHT34_01650, partial [Clostridia bacterium]|nr:hypothetical protein [Clostridia bacterium]